MIELRGKHTNALVYTDLIEDEAISQIINLCNQEFVQGQKVRVMPDVHAGKGCTIGTTMTITDKVVPNLVGVDIGCGMGVTKLKEKRIELPKLDSVINKLIPSGFNVRTKNHKFNSRVDLEELRCASVINLDRAYKSIGTLGGGNHFIEIERGSDDSLYLVVHTGSRNLGTQVCKYYQEQAYKNMVERQQGFKEKSEELIKELKNQGKQADIAGELEKLKKSLPQINLNRELAFCEGRLLDDYIHDMRITQEYAAINREAIAYEILDAMKLHEEESFQTIHNYIDMDTMILRKGAVSAKSDEVLLIPINMRDGSLLCRGKGNLDWNCSAPHGAGRLMSRSSAKESFSVSEFKKTMEEANVYSSSVGKSTLDECPMAYKPIEAITDNICETVDIIDILKPIYNFKAGDSND